MKFEIAAALILTIGLVPILVVIVLIGVGHGPKKAKNNQSGFSDITHMILSTITGLGMLILTQFMN